MKKIAVLALHDATMNSIDSCYQLFNRVNDFMRYQQRPPFYAIQVVGIAGTVQLSGGLYAIHTHCTLQNADKPDIIVLPLLCGNFDRAIKENAGYTDWLLQHYEKGAEIVCLCSGAFYLASTGLLNGRECAVHWAAQEEFKYRFPEVQIMDEQLITDQRGVYTCGGGYSFLNLLLYILEKHLGRETAVLASKMFEIDLARDSQRPFAIFQGQKQHGDELVLRIQEYLESRPNENISVTKLCAELPVSRRTFERRFKTCTGNGISEYMRRVKVEFAKKELETGRKTVNEIIYETGYNDIDAFRKVFRKITGLAPSDYGKRFAAYHAPGAGRKEAQ